jgi:hypothetical protein
MAKKNLGDDGGDEDSEVVLTTVEGAMKAQRKLRTTYYY